ncbi:MAG: glycosyltransferase [Phycisphaerae bacterium]|nr:glycosyltransferase [Phycisphaerae bacterium]
MILALWFWLGLTTLAFVVWMSRHLQIGRVARIMPPLHSGMYADSSGELPLVSILVAAKEEESNIGGCLKSLIAQDYPDFEVIAIDDRSTDRTGEIIDALAAGDDRLTALHIRELQPGWFGKNNAMREGIERARGEWFCFTDADCVFVSRRALAVAMRYATEKGADFLSVLPAHETDSFWERVIQPACSGILLIWFNPLRVNDPKRRTAYANGAFMLMRRSCHEAVGGHEAVKAEVNEDMHLARRAKEADQRLVVVSNKDLYSVRMYDSFVHIWSGWTRIFYGCFGTLRRLFLSILVVTTFSLLPWAALVSGVTLQCLGPGTSAAWQILTWVAGATCAAQISVMFRFYALNRSHPLYGLTYPVGAAIGAAALVNALRRVGGRRSITWRGTTYKGKCVIPSDQVLEERE